MGDAGRRRCERDTAAGVPRHPGRFRSYDTAAGIDEQQEFEALYWSFGDMGFRRRDGGRLRRSRLSLRRSGGRRLRAPGSAARRVEVLHLGEKDVQARLVANRPLEVFRNRELKLTSRPGETEEAFLARCDEAGQARADEETVKLTKRLESKKDRLESAKELAQRRVAELDTQTKSRQANELITGAGAVLGALFGGKRSARSITNAVGSVASKHGQAATSSARRDTAEAKVEQTTDDLAQLEQEIIDEVTAIDDRWKTMAEAIEPVSIRLEATDVRVTDVRLVGSRSTRGSGDRRRSRAPGGGRRGIDVRLGGGDHPDGRAGDRRVRERR